MFFRPSLCQGFRRFPSVFLAAIAVCALMLPPLAVTPVSAQDPTCRPCQARRPPSHVAAYEILRHPQSLTPGQARGTDSLRAFR